jgi:hypothetical protein
MSCVSKFRIIFSIVIILNGCEKKAEVLTQSQTGIPITEISGVHSKEVFDNGDPEKKNVVTANIAQEVIEEFLADFFQSKNYVLMEEPLDVYSRKIHFAVHYIMEAPKVFDMAVGFEIIDGTVTPYFFLKDFIFFDSRYSIIENLSKHNDIFGFDFMYSYPKQPSLYMPGLVMRTYFDNGKREADTFDLDWNEEEKTFKCSY